MTTTVATYADTNYEVYDGVENHTYFPNSRRGYKSVCTSACLGTLGIPPSAYHYCAHRDQRDSVLRRSGYAVRSRVSHTKKAKTVNQLRPLLRKNREKWGDARVGAVYLVTVTCPPNDDGPGGRHLILLNHLGETVTDTAPVKDTARDDRQVNHVQAVFPKCYR